MSDAVFLPVSWLFGLIGFNTTDVVGGALHQCLDQGVGLFLREGDREGGGVSAQSLQDGSVGSMLETTETRPTKYENTKDYGYNCYTLDPEN